MIKSMGSSPLRTQERNTWQWLQGILRLQGSVIPNILPRVLACGFLGFVVSILYRQGYQVSYPFADVIPSIVLGLLLVFRTNTAYDRYWEGRKIWGNLMDTNRNIARQIWVFVEEKSPQDHVHKVMVLRLVIAMAIALKLKLRGQPINEEIQELLPDHQFQKLQVANHPPLEIAFWINDYLNQQARRGCLGTYELTSISALLAKQVESMGACDRILKTPLPLAYAIHLRQLLTIYCMLLPFQWVSKWELLTGPMVGLLSFTLLGIEEIGLEIENPFGTDPNDLPLDAICKLMGRDIEDTIVLNPTPCHWLHPSSNLDLPQPEPAPRF